jgi:two-component system CheB/CheR fusion protein
MENSEVKKSEPAEAKKLAVHYMETLIDVARESFLILDSKLRVISANPIFYDTFHVLATETENKFLYDLGNGQWNIPELKSLLEKILPEKKTVKNFQVAHVFETIGEKTMLLNAREIDAVQLIILAIEDITPRRELEEKLAEYTKELEIKVAERTTDLANRIKELETLNKTMVGRECRMVELKKEIEDLKKLVKNSNGNHNGHSK